MSCQPTNTATRKESRLNVTRNRINSSDEPHYTRIWFPFMSVDPVAGLIFGRISESEVHLRFLSWIELQRIMGWMSPFWDLKSHVTHYFIPLYPHGDIWGSFGMQSFPMLPWFLLGTYLFSQNEQCQIICVSHCCCWLNQKRPSREVRHRFWPI